MVHETTFFDFLYNYRMKHEIYNYITHKQKKLHARKTLNPIRLRAPGSSHPTE